MKKNKAFTLVELLGVIILLGIVGIIITPNILKIQKKAAKDSFEASINTLIKSAQNYYANNDFINYPSSGIAANSELLNVKNSSEFSNGTIKLIDNEYFFAENISNGSFCANGTRNDLAITEGECPETPVYCFDFEEETGTISKYNRNKNGCDVLTPTIPDRINDVAVTTIGFAAFTEPESITCSKDKWTTRYTVSLDHKPREDELCYIETNDSYNPLTSVVLPKYLQTIEQAAFEYNQIKILDLTSLTNLENIKYSAFWGNDILSLNFNNNKKLKEIGNEAFGANYNLEKIIINDLPLLETIGDYSFEWIGNASVELINLPNLSYLGYGAFSEGYAKSAKLMNLPKIEILYEDLFFYSELEDLYISDMPNLKTIETNAFSKNKIKEIKLENLPELVTIGNNAFQNNRAATISLLNLPKLNSIGTWAFAANSANTLNLKNLTSLNTISSYAFHGDYIKELDLSEAPNLVSIGSQGFYCNSINTIKFNNPKLTTIGNYAFLYSPRVGMNLENTGIVSIGTEAFGRNTMTNLTIPTSLNTIGNGGFSQETRKYEKITVLGTATQRIRFNTYWTNYGFPSDLKPSLLG